jgi:hypothetical protein
MSYEQILLLLSVGLGLTLVAAFIWWQNERDLAPLRKEHSKKK